MKGPQRVVAACFIGSIVAAIGLFVVYLRGGQTQLEGALLFLALGGIGVGLLVWATRLMTHIPDETQTRHHEPADAAELETAADTVLGGMEQMHRRRFLTGILLGALGALAAAALFPIRSLGRSPGDTPFRTKWRRGSRMVDVEGNPVTIDTLKVDSFTTVFPEGDLGSADSQTLLIKVDPDLLDDPGDQAAARHGLVAYSKVCTHAGCPIGLYLAADHELRCPCHQSTFDVLEGARPVYGPAPRPLPRLPIEVDPDGRVIAMGDFDTPIGPSFWNMNDGPSS